MNKPHLTLIIAIACALIGGCTKNINDTDVENEALTLTEVRKLTSDKAGSTLLIDARTPQDYAAGHIPGAVNLPLPELRERLGELDKSKKLYVNCYSGMRSYIACRILAGHGFACSNLSGGWRFYELASGDSGVREDEHHPCGERK